MIRRRLVLPAVLVAALAACGSSRPADGAESGCGSCHGFPPATHAAHVSGATLSNGFACSSCHPDLDGYDASHADGTLDVSFSALPIPGGAFAGGACSATYCHGTFVGGSAAAPAWGGTAACGSCHPAQPTTAWHAEHVVDAGVGCGACHTGYTATTVDPALHVNFVKDVPRLTTTACHPFGSGDNYGSSCDGRSDW